MNLGPKSDLVANTYNKEATFLKDLAFEFKIFALHNVVGLSPLGH